MYIIICETDCQSWFDAWDRMLSAGALGWPSGMGWGGRCEGGSGWETHVHPWLIHVNVCQKPLQYCEVIGLQLNKLKKIKIKSASLSRSLSTENQENWLQSREHDLQVQHIFTKSYCIRRSELFQMCFDRKSASQNFVKQIGGKQRIHRRQLIKTQHSMYFVQVQRKLWHACFLVGKALK